MEPWIIFIIAFFIVDTVLVIYIVSKRSKSKKFSKYDEKYIRQHWENVLGEVNYNPGRAVLDADKILDYALKKKGYTGSVGEKLKVSNAHFSDLNGVWSAHKLRNKIAHELGDVSKKDANRALGQFKRALKDLGVNL